MGQTTGQKREDERPIVLEGVPEEEDVPTADAPEQAAKAPEEKVNRPDQPDFDPDERRQYDDPPIETAGPDPDRSSLEEHDRPRDR